ncbi:DUF1631 family protein [Diaphorobacter aerolatus]|uniref:DUF1631 domain-containing protein n=1 Tax=Diaphorobacter aerolatus TaxID=1288495 RepID=A0A7H0GGT9_9BURK|nr:DUF1631 family protein [Diaphorobacter aerolatus]QNP47505.1 DUF1631 domain-containing protein [Diaphorobacter aerolatus]
MEYPPSSPTDQRLALHGRQRFAEGVVAGLAALGTRLQEFFLTLAEQSGVVRDMQTNRDAWMSYKAHEADWLQRLTRTWNEAGAAGSTLHQAASTVSPAPNELSLDGGFELLSDDVVENKILASRIALTVSEQAGSHFETVKVRTQRLQGRELSSRDLLRPETVCLDVVDQWIESGMSRADLQLVIDPLQTELGNLLEKEYKALNKLFEERGVSASASDDLRSRVKRTASHGGGGAGNSMAGALNSGYDSGPAPMGQSSGFGGMPLHGYPTGFGVAGAGGLFPMPQGAGWANPGQMHQPGAAHAGHGGHAAHPPGSQFSSQPMPQMSPQLAAQINAQMAMNAQLNAQMSAQMAASPFLAPLQRARQRAAAVMVQLRNLLTQPAMNYDMVNAPPASAALVQAMTNYHAMSPDTMLLTVPGGMAALTKPQDYTPQVVNQVIGAVRERAAEFKKKASSASEKAIIEVVALMFQSILNEDRLPPSIRVWFARLQVPVLRVALEEPEFFNNVTHPARQLIDRMGACVLGFDAATINGTALEAEVRRVVQVIEQYPETGSRVFQLVFEEFERFIAKSLAESKSTQKIVGVAQQVEQRETLSVQYTIELRDMLKDMQVRDEIREFLFKNWAEVLAVSAVRSGPQHDETVALKRTAADLVWAASAKPHRSERAQVIQNLPNLLQNLRHGLSLTGVTGAPQDALIKVLTDTLADAFLSKTATIPREYIDAMIQRLANLEDVIGDTDAGDFELSSENVEMLLGIDASSIHVIPDNGSPVRDEVVRWAQQMPLGAWFTLDHNGSSAQVQYAWHSRRKKLHLFAAIDGTSYLIQLRRLGTYLQSGLLVAQEEEALTMRATRDALVKLNANPERLLG